MEEGVYAWDGGLLSNTPLREVIDASPVNDKRVYIVENHPKKVDILPKNLVEIYHRTRDIIYTEKTEYNVTMSKVITQYLSYIDELYQLIENKIDLTNVDEKQLKMIRRKYKRLKLERGMLKSKRSFTLHVMNLFLISMKMQIFRPKPSRIQL